VAIKFVVATAFSDPTHYCELARVAEECGYDAISVSDHVVHPEKITSRYPYTEDGSPRFGSETPWPDPWVSIGAMAAVTRRIHFLTNVFVLPMRHPLLVAKAVSSAAVLSGDRVALGIGVGWLKQEFELLGQGFHDRGRRTDEMIAVLRKLWSGDWAEHHGRFYEFGRLRMRPAPARPVPIYVGGTSEAALRRAATLGDGWISELHSTEELGRLIGRLRAQRKDCGRGHEPLAIFGATPDAFDLDGYRRLEALGVTHVVTLPWVFYGGRTDSLQEKKVGLRRFAEDVLAALH
jgi:probable F420-dependent oxidoreductase